jgi:CubicO group peptidase (beta-lactamase class C family)
MGKTYTATAIMQLVEQGIIGLYDPVNKYLKEFQVINPLGQRDVTVYDLLTHRSGLSTNNAGSDFVAPVSLGKYLKDGYGQKMFEQYNGTLQPRWSAQVGEKFQYSNFGVATLGYLVEVTNPEKLSFSQYVQKHIIDPLGMTSTQFPEVQDAAHVRPDIFARLSKGYAHLGPVDIPTPAIYFAAYPAGTVVTIPADHIRILLAYLNGGNYHGYQLLKPETVQHMLTFQTPFQSTHDKSGGIGLIWWLRNIDKPNFNFGHMGGHMFGWNNDFRAYPSQDFAVVVATNVWNMTDLSAQYVEGKEIGEFISSWIAHEKENVHHAELRSSWAWKVSYVMGLVMAEQMKGALGIKTPLSSKMVEDMATGAHVRIEDEKGAEDWDPAGFRTGVEDMLSVEMTVSAINAFMASDRLRVPPAELGIIFRELEAKEVAIPIGPD